MSGASAARACSTDCCRLSPPCTSRTGLGSASSFSISPTHSMSSARSATTISSTIAQATNLRMVWSRIGEPSSNMNCLRLVPVFSALLRPMRVPKPAAGRMTAVFIDWRYDCIPDRDRPARVFGWPGTWNEGRGPGLPGQAPGDVLGRYVMGGADAAAGCSRCECCLSACCACLS